MIKVSFVTKDKIKEQAEDFLKQYHPSKKIPIPIDLIAENLGIDIVPIPNLRECFGTEAFISSDLSQISIDSDTYNTNEQRYRYSIAHELGHYFMHKNYFGKINFNSPEEWTDLYCNMIDENDYSKLEFQAYYFGGVVLIPDYSLVGKFTEEVNQISNLISEAKKQGLNKKNYLDNVIDKIARDLSPFYNVSTECMIKRIEQDDNLCELIP